jgi:hypothetical protein
MTFGEFVRTLHPSVTPAGATEEYKQYRADFYGGAIKAEFEERKGDPV